MKRNLILLLESMLADAGIGCHISTTRDLKTIMSRFEHEGMSFLTISLPTFGKDFHKSLDQGFVGHDQFFGFSKAGSLPRFLGGFFDHVFDRKEGRLLPDPCISCIREIRQLTLAFSKVQLECTEARQRAAINKYLEVEKVLKSRAAFPVGYQERFQRLTSVILGQFLQGIEESIFYGLAVPGHGSGATADKLMGNQKWTQQEWPNRLEEEFPSGEYLIPNWRYRKYLQTVKYLDPEQERPVKVLLVPKTLKTPRIIAKEPTAMMYVQQALHTLIQDALDNPIGNNIFGVKRNDSLVSSFIGYSSQAPNQALARQGSRDGTLATLDLSEASDRVSNQHVRLLLHRHPYLFRAVDACRSRKADVPGHGVIRLAKFASMGSGLCFPIESMVFLIIVFLGIEDALNRPLTRKDVKSMSGKVRIYGDDIIVPVDMVASVCEALSSFGMIVNLDKSFWTGKFRESCGAEFYDGEDVTLVRVRTELPTKRRHVQEIVSIVPTRNLFYKIGYWKTARYLDSLISGIIPFPVVKKAFAGLRVMRAGESQVLGRMSFLLGDIYPLAVKQHQTLHHPLVKGCVVSVRLPRSVLGEHHALTKFLTKRSDLPNADVRHLERAGRPLSIDIKQRLVSPY